MKKIVVLGISGSIGKQTLDVIDAYPEEFKLVGCSVGKNIAYLDTILSKSNSIQLVCTQLEEDAISLQEKYPNYKFVFGEEGLIELATLKEADTLVNALVGFAGLTPTLKAIETRKTIALANKETLVVAGKFVLEACKQYGVDLLPIDSEHSAIFQCLQGNKRDEVKSITLTASGGSFRDRNREDLIHVTKEDALAHPNWSMGSKITIDSATMMNKGFEVIEAHWLFQLPFEQIKVIIHRESVIHSFVEYVDSSVIAQLGTPDMRLPIQYALSYPNRLPLQNANFLDLAKVGMLQFKEVEEGRYPLLEIAYQVGKKQGNLPAILNAANEEAVSAFLQDKISFLEIEEIVLTACKQIEYRDEISLEDIYIADQQAREFVHRYIEELKICR